ncbi:diacylglycerol kinase family protein [Mycoplasma todarodis]|uniref:Diacylglycerol kinase n=1 Tax=Mycoplasma todarodis TaxID=1937191 RepID=A0A4R0XT97_9MOLU|nr:diacylglycerol kinase family protein [Mycoplasma todarodis]TCG10849.1 diacylglycerol kinase [Mycoplasma todarodis]
MKKFIKKTQRKFLYALIGLWVTVKEEKSLLTHMLITAVVIGLGIWVKLSLTHWAILVITISIVMGFEVLNTAMEALVDMISFQYNLKVKKVKDIAAGATLLVAIAAIVVGMLIFIPEFKDIAHGIR